jgi:hypothetical protein
MIDNTPIKNAYELSMINGVTVLDADNMKTFVDFRLREKALETARRTQEEECINERLSMFNNCSKMTAGVAFSAGNVCLSDGRIHQKVREQYKNRQQKY